KGKLVGAKPPLRPSHVWSIRTKLQIEGKKRDLTLFNLAIDSKLRGCDVVAVRVDAVAPGGYSMDRNHPPEEDGAASSLRADRPDTSGHRRVSSSNRPQAGPIPFRRSRRQRRAHDTTVCSARAGVGGEHWSRPGEVRHALAASDEGGVDLSANRQPPC